MFKKKRNISVPKVPKSIFIRIERHVFSTVRVTTTVSQPYVVSGVSKLQSCKHVHIQFKINTYNNYIIIFNV